MSEITDSEQIQSVIYYYTNYESKDWRKVLELGNCFTQLSDKRRLSWVWPSQTDIQQLQMIFKQTKIRTLLSVGCGCGLFEWILRESIGVSIFGLERDRNWWQSNHSVKSFIKLNYIDDLKPNCLPETFMQRCCDIHDEKNWKFALMFVYFNNRPAFLNYLRMYKGTWVIIVGPRSDVSIHTDPTPLEPNFPENTHWSLHHEMAIDDNDIVVIYKNESDELTVLE